MDEIQDVAVMQPVTIHLMVGPPESVQSTKTWRDLKKQECVVADVTGAVRLVLWEKDIGSLKDDASYKIYALVEINTFLCRITVL